MNEIHLGAVESRFADLVWTHAPLPSGELVKLCQEELHWKKPTTYTVLRKLCEKGLFRNENGLVTAHKYGKATIHAAMADGYSAFCVSIQTVLPFGAFQNRIVLKAA